MVLLATPDMGEGEGGVGLYLFHRRFHVPFSVTTIDDFEVIRPELECSSEVFYWIKAVNG